MKKILYVLGFLSLCSVTIYAQIDARMFRYPDVSETQITFVYGDDIWIVNKEGGLANRLSSPKGEESFPKFSPDGKQIAFTGNYDGNSDIYVIPAIGGTPERITHHGMTDVVQDWFPDGKNILYTTSMYSGRQRYSQFFKVSANGGFAEKLTVPYGEFGSISEDGNKIAYTKISRLFRTWKRYRGGMAADIYIFDLNSLESENVTNNTANDELPMWQGDKIYYLSDDTKEMRNNLFVYDIKSKVRKQLTHFTDFDIHFPSIGSKDLVFEAGGFLYLFDLETEKVKDVNISVVTDQTALKPVVKKVNDLLSYANPSPDGKRAVVEARGELFSIPAEYGPILNLTQSCGSAERYPTWSPNGKSIAFWSDKSGEYELYIYNVEKETSKKVSRLGKGFRYQIYWAPDSKKISFVDQAMNIYVYDVENEKAIVADKGLYMMEGGLENFKPSWTSDSRWLAYSRGLNNQQNAIFIYDTKENKAHQVTSGYYYDASPEFDKEGKYLFYSTNRNLNPVYSDIDNTFIYPNTTQIAAIPLTAETASPLATRNDEVEIKKEEKKKDDKKSDEKDKKDEKKEDKSVKIDFKDFEERVVILPIDAGNMGNLQSVEGKLLFHKFPNSGSSDKNRSVMYYDLKERETKTIIDDANDYMVTANGKKVLVTSKGKSGFIDIAEKQKLEKTLRTNEMEMTVIPHQEWNQIFMDVWRLERDMFYDPNMHGVDWEAMRNRYGKLVDFAVTRNDLNFILGELIGELNSSHSYRGGGDRERPERRNVGYLGVDWQIENGMYKIDKIINGAQWDAEIRSPLAKPGIKAGKGDFLIAVNGKKVSVDKDPYAAFQDLAGKTVELTFKDGKADTTKKVIVKLLDSEIRLRHLSWIEKNRKRVEEATNGKIGYVYVRSTGRDGQTELIRQFMAQVDKQGLIIDERFNNGGQIPDRFIEQLNRKPLAYWAVRDGKTWRHPSKAIYGPKVMMINGWSGSGGDAFPDYFRKANLGSLVGKRTWGGLIGISGAPNLIDGGYFTIPTFRMFDPDGKWFKEGHGVDPDYEVDDNPTDLAKGVDPQLEKAINVILDELKTSPYKDPEVPAYEKR